MPIMECGCSGQSKIKGAWGCGLHQSTKPMDPQPNLSNRMARCDYGDSSIQSNPNLAFFVYRPNKDTDKYYCGCRGWD